MNSPSVVQAIYLPKEGKEEEMLSLLTKHWKVLHQENLVTDTPALLYRARDGKTKRDYFVEIFSWRDEKSVYTAHNNKNVMEIWEPIGMILETGQVPEVTTLEPLKIEV